MMKFIIFLALSNLTQEIFANESFNTENIINNFTRKIQSGPVKLMNVNYTDYLVSSVCEENTLMCVKVDALNTAIENEYKWMFIYTGSDLNFQIKHVETGKYLLPDNAITNDDDEKSNVYLASSDNIEDFNRKSIWYLVVLRSDVNYHFYIKSWYHNTYLVASKTKSSQTRYVYSQHEKQAWEAIYENEM